MTDKSTSSLSSNSQIPTVDESFKPSELALECQEIKLDTPDRLSRSAVNWEPLAVRIAALPSGRCVKIPRYLDNSLRSSLRNYCEKHHRVKIITRTRPGLTYIWNGGTL